MSRLPSKNGQWPGHAVSDQGGETQQRRCEYAQRGVEAGIHIGLSGFDIEQVGAGADNPLPGFELLND